MLESILSLTFLAQGLRISIPYILPALGGTFSERSGVVNIALEGMLLVGGFATAAGTYFTDNPFIGILCGIAAGMVLSVIHGLASVTFKVDQIITGIALNLLAVGGTKFTSQWIFHSSSNSPRIAGVERMDIPFLNEYPLINLLLKPFVLLTIVLIVAANFVLFKTRFGLRLRAVGEHPEAADSLGISVARMRFSGVLISGLCSGLGGAWLALDQHSFTDGMSAGRGFIALAAIIVGKWKPLAATVACIVFGFAEALALQLQSGNIPTQFIQMIPYVLTMIALAGFIGRSSPPASDGIPYEK
ncbi:MAG TPA: ABC transporter permease [Bacteroidota bacterium]|jgi:simple sugar transport system permease protein|nr:ABC transporter permease [Bacteroidota bacterium]